MAKKKIIQINCTGTRYVPHTSLKAFQGNLKEMTEAAAEMFKKNILELGWVAPIFVWKDKNYILDGHGRLAVLQSLLEDGYTIGKLPVIDIKAKTKKQAGKILLALNAQYQTMTDEGLYEFMHSTGLELTDLNDFTFADVNLSKFESGYFTEPEPPEGATTTESKSKGTEIQYNIIFGSEAEQEVWFGYIRHLKAKYPAMNTISERIVKDLEDNVLTT